MGRGSSPLPGAPSLSESPSPSGAPPLRESLPSSHPRTGQAGTLTPGHLDELSDTEHTGGDKALLEVGGVCNREKTGVTGSVSFLDTMGYPDSGGLGVTLSTLCSPAARWRKRPDPGANLASAATGDMILGKSLLIPEPRALSSWKCHLGSWEIRAYSPGGAGLPASRHLLCHQQCSLLSIPLQTGSSVRLGFCVPRSQGVP